jgi:Mg2+ and Co2+ transporter CorA
VKALERIAALLVESAWLRDLLAVGIGELIDARSRQERDALRPQIRAIEREIEAIEAAIDDIGRLRPVLPPTWARDRLAHPETAR